jgi:hypothetical protein
MKIWWNFGKFCAFDQSMKITIKDTETILKDKLKIWVK